MSIGELAALASAFLWALTTVMMRSQSARVDPLSMNTLRSVIGAAFFIVTLFLVDKWGLLAQVSPGTFLALCASLVCGYVLGDTFFFRSMQLVGVSTAMPLGMTYPLYVLVIAWAFLGEHVTWLTVLGTLLTVLGTLSVAAGAQSVQARTPEERKWGVALAILSAWCFAGSTTFLKVGVNDTDVFVAGTIRMSITAVLLLLWRASIVQAAPFRDYGGRALGVIAVAAIVGTGLGTITYLTAIQQAGAAIAAALATTAPLFSTPLSALFLKEKLTRKNVLGMVLCVAGVWLVVMK